MKKHIYQYLLCMLFGVSFVAQASCSFTQLICGDVFVKSMEGGDDGGYDSGDDPFEA